MLLVSIFVVLDAALGEIITTCSKLDWLINHGERALSPESRYNNLIMFYKSSSVHYEPLGVVAAITSWNYRKTILPLRMATVLNFATQRCIMLGHLSLPDFLLGTAWS